MSRRPTVPVEQLLAAIPEWPELRPIADVARLAGVSQALLWSRLVRMTYTNDILILEDDAGRIAKIDRADLLNN